MTDCTSSRADAAPPSHDSGATYAGGTPNPKPHDYSDHPARVLGHFVGGLFQSVGRVPTNGPPLGLAPDKLECVIDILLDAGKQLTECLFRTGKPDKG